ncbi:hypothetical protein A2U01_0068090 [Trifolium medium]|uniref:Uncharacterized protein n=1 Tax=Trifolium medium TaxID=97028 RepID=A0A392SDX3_9FABA|nr:hypothetical protein [Trifolium medium]
MIAMQESMYNMHLNQQVMNTTDFQADVTWPGDRPQFMEGVDVADVADDDEIDDAAADAVDDETTQSGDEGDDDRMSD